MAHSTFIPYKFKFRKVHKQLYRLRGRTVAAMDGGVDGCFVVSRGGSRYSPPQFEAFRRVVRRVLGRRGRLVYHFVCDQPLTAKSSGIRMGKGKGVVKQWAFASRHGFVLFRLSDISSVSGFYAMAKALKKLPGGNVVRRRVLDFRLRRV